MAFTLCTGGFVVRKLFVFCWLNASVHRDMRDCKGEWHIPEPRTLEELRVALLAQMEEFGLSPFRPAERQGSRCSGRRRHQCGHLGRAGMPNLQGGFQAGRLGSWVPGTSFPPKGQEIATAGVGWVFNPAIFGQAKAAGANEQIAELEVKRLFDGHARLGRRAHALRWAGDVGPAARALVLAWRYHDDVRQLRRRVRSGTATA